MNQSNCYSDEAVLDQLKSAAYAAYPGIIIRSITISDADVIHGQTVKCNFSHWTLDIELATATFNCSPYAEMSEIVDNFIDSLKKFFQ